LIFNEKGVRTHTAIAMDLHEVVDFGSSEDLACSRHHDGAVKKRVPEDFGIVSDEKLTTEIIPKIRISEDFSASGDDDVTFELRATADDGTVENLDGSDERCRAANLRFST